MPVSADNTPRRRVITKRLAYRNYGPGHRPSYWCVYSIYRGARKAYTVPYGVFWVQS